MSDLEQTINTIINELDSAVDDYGLAALARESGISYPVLYGYKRRKWRNKNLEILLKSLAAAKRLKDGAGDHHILVSNRK